MVHEDPWVNPSNTEKSPLELDYMVSLLLYPKSIQLLEVAQKHGNTFRTVWNVDR